MSGQMIEPLSDGPLKVSTVASMSFSSANDEPLVQRKIHHHHHWSPSWQYKEGPTTQATQVEPQAILFKAALPNNELPSRRKGHQSTLKDFIGERRVTKGGKPSRALRMRHSTGNIGAKHHAAIPPAAEMASTSWDGKQVGTAAPTEPTPEPEALSTLDEIRQRVGKSVGQLFTLADAIRAPLPTQTGDGSELPKTAADSVVKDMSVVLRDIKNLGFNKIEDLAEVVVNARFDKPLDDKKYLMEHLIQAASSLPDDVTSKNITNGFLTTLWNDLQHPPQMLLSDEFVFRQPDGSKNNYAMPHIGAAGMPYARTVAPKTLRSGVMPDPGVIFDTVMKRKNEEGTPHPNRISSMLFYLASIIIHDVFKTDHDDYTKSLTSSYLDLAPLYGSNWEEQKRMRTMKDGKLKPDCFSETRLLGFPPGVGAILIMFNRYHNYVVEQLALINEDGRFSERRKEKDRIVERYGEKIERRDDDLFQTGRLITCGLYVNIILIDYVRTILNLNRTDDNWQLNPRADIPDGPCPGTGNQVSCEFNLVYRWHASISPKDDEWTWKLFQQMFPGFKPEDTSNPEMMGKLLQQLAKEEMEKAAQEPMERQFPALDEEAIQRIKDGPFKGRYSDDDLASILTAGIDDCANAMGPQKTPKIMRMVEILGIMQARAWRVSTLNEFRKHFALAPHETFESITDNKEVAEALKHLYITPDKVELYPGLVIEDAKKPMLPGSGLCPSYTVSRGVLSDAVALVRGDRFYTTSYTPAALTAWGYQEASSDVTIDNGCVFYKLFLRALPNNYDPASVYVHYPMTISHGPDGMQDVLQRLGKAHKYDFTKPVPIKQPTMVFSYEAARKVLDDQDTFYVTWGKAMEFLMGPAAKNFMLAGDGEKNAASRKLMEDALYLGGSSRDTPSGNEKWLTAVREFYEEKTKQLLEQKTYKLAGVNEVDIIRDVGNMAHVHFAAEMFSLPLKTEDFPRGIFTENQLYLIMAGVFIAVFFDVDPPKSFPLRQKAYEATQTLGQIMQVQVAAIKSTGKLAETLFEAVKPTNSALKDYGVHMIAHLLKNDPNIGDLVWGNIMGTVGGMCANQGQLLGQVLDYYLGDEEGKKHWKTIQKLAQQPDSTNTDEKLMHYLLEGARLNGETGVFRWVQKNVTIVDKTTPEIPGLPTEHKLKAGDKVMVNLKAASRDPKGYPNPDQVDLNRPIDSYIQLGHGAHQCLGFPMTRTALTTMLKVFARLPNLRPSKVAIGSQPIPVDSKVKKVTREFVPGDLKVVPESWHYHAFLTPDWDQYFPFPTSLKVNYD